MNKLTGYLNSKRCRFRKVHLNVFLMILKLHGHCRYKGFFYSLVTRPRTKIIRPCYLENNILINIF